LLAKHLEHYKSELREKKKELEDEQRKASGEEAPAEVPPDPLPEPTPEPPPRETTIDREPPYATSGDAPRYGDTTAQDTEFDSEPTMPRYEPGPDFSIPDPEPVQKPELESDLETVAEEEPETIPEGETILDPEPETSKEPERGEDDRDQEQAQEEGEPASEVEAVAEPESSPETEPIQKISGEVKESREQLEQEVLEKILKESGVAIHTSLPSEYHPRGQAGFTDKEDGRFKKDILEDAGSHGGYVTWFFDKDLWNMDSFDNLDKMGMEFGDNIGDVLGRNNITEAVGIAPVEGKMKDVVRGGKSEAVSRFMYAADAWGMDTPGYKDYSGRDGQLFSLDCILPQKTADMLLERINENPAFVREVVKQLMINNLQIPEKAWEQGDAHTNGYPLRPPYEKWAEHNGGVAKMYVVKPGDRGGFKPENIVEIPGQLVSAEGGSEPEAPEETLELESKLTPEAEQRLRAWESLKEKIRETYLKDHFDKENFDDTESILKSGIAGGTELYRLGGKISKFISTPEDCAMLAKVFSGIRSGNFSVFVPMIGKRYNSKTMSIVGQEDTKGRTVDQVEPFKAGDVVGISNIGLQYPDGEMMAGGKAEVIISR